MITLHLDHKPTSWAAPQRCKNIYFNPKHKQKVFVRNLIKSQYSGPLLTDYLRIDMIFIMKVPKSATKKKSELMLQGRIIPTNVDTSNCFKFYEDCLKQTVIYDDRAVAEISARKLYGTKDHVTIFIQELNANTNSGN